MNGTLKYATDTNDNTANQINARVFSALRPIRITAAITSATTAGSRPLKIAATQPMPALLINIQLNA